MTVLCGTKQEDGSWTLSSLETVIYHEQQSDRRYYQKYGNLAVCNTYYQNKPRPGYHEASVFVRSNELAVKAVEVDYDDVPRFMRLHMANGKMLELGHTDRRCGGFVGRQDCHTFDSRKLLPAAAYHIDAWTGKKIINWEVSAAAAPVALAGCWLDSALHLHDACQ